MTSSILLSKKRFPLGVDIPDNLSSLPASTVVILYAGFKSEFSILSPIIAIYLVRSPTAVVFVVPFIIIYSI